MDVCKLPSSLTATKAHGKSQDNKGGLAGQATFVENVEVASGSCSGQVLLEMPAHKHS